MLPNQKMKISPEEILTIQVLVLNDVIYEDASDKYEFKKVTTLDEVSKYLKARPIVHVHDE